MKMQRLIARIFAQPWRRWAQWSNGRGRKIMQSRITELGGSLDWVASDGHCRMVARIPLA